MKKQPPLAVALQYDGENTPIVSAKGQNKLADEIIEIAQKHNIPLQYDPELAAILSQVPSGDEIPENLFLAVAEVISFAYIIKGKFPKNFSTK